MMQKYKPILLIVFVLSVAVLIWMDTGTRVVEGKPACVSQSVGVGKNSRLICVSVQPEKAYRGRYSQYKGIEVALCIVAILSGSAYIYTNLPKKLIRNSIPKKED